MPFVMSLTFTPYGRAWCVSASVHGRSVCRYVYLLDGQGRVRLRASGPAQGDEVDTLLQAAQQLLDKE